MRGAGVVSAPEPPPTKLRKLEALGWAVLMPRYELEGGRKQPGGAAEHYKTEMDCFEWIKFRVRYKNDWKIHVRNRASQG